VSLPVLVCGGATTTSRAGFPQKRIPFFTNPPRRCVLVCLSLPSLAFSHLLSYGLWSVLPSSAVKSPPRHIGVFSRCNPVAFVHTQTSVWPLPEPPLPYLHSLIPPYSVSPPDTISIHLSFGLGFPVKRFSFLGDILVLIFPSCLSLSFPRFKGFVS